MDAWLEQSIPLQILTGVGLAAAAGLRAFLPPLVVGLLARFGIVPLHPGFEWMASTPALIIFGTAVAAELLGDKFPAVDHALDTVGIVLKPASGTVLLASSLTEFSPMTATVLGILFGGTVAVAVHVTKAGLRLATTAVTGGMGNPAVSAVEDGVSLAGTFVAALFPLFLVPLAVAVFFLVRAAVRRWRRRSAPAAADAVTVAPRGA